MNQNDRIVVNALATYGRSLVTLCLGLFSARWVLAALGEVDFGLYGVIGSIIVFITFFNGVLGTSVARYYAYIIGERKIIGESNAESKLKLWFNSALSVHVLLAIILTVVGYPIGVYAIRHWLAIPVERIMACIWVFRISLATAFVSMWSIPFVSFYTAYQNIAELAFYGVAISSIVFLGAYSLFWVTGDRLIVYSTIMMLTYTVILVLQCIRATLKFSACRIDARLWFNAKIAKTIFAYSGWQLFGNCGSMFRAQACALLTNIYFGPKINAAYSISGQITSHTGTLAQALISAFTPAVTSKEGSGDRMGMIDMAWRTSRLGTFLILLFIIPLSLEIDEVLRLWLKNPPQYSGALCFVAFVEVILGKMTVGNQLAISAQGKIAAYQVTIGGIMISTLLWAWVFIKCGLGPMSVVYACVITSLMASIGRVCFTRYQLGMSPIHWMNKVVLPLIALIVISSSLGAISRLFMGPCFARICLTTAFTLLGSICCGWLFVLDAKERQYFARQLHKLKGSVL